MLEDYKEYYRKKEESKIINGVLSKFPLLGATISTLTFSPDNCKTARTDGDRILYSENFLDKLSYEEKVFVFAHEIMHVALEHIYRMKDHEKILWNKATDAVINARLVAEGLPMIDGGVDMPSALDKSAEEVYKILEEKEKNNQNNSSQKGSNGGGQSSDGQGDIGQSGGGESGDSDDCTGEGHDEHDIWGDVVKRMNEGADNDSNNGVNDNNSSVVDKNDSSGKEDNKQKRNKDLSNEEKKSLEDFEKNFTKDNKKLKNQLAKDIISGMKKAGKSAGNKSVSFGDVGLAKAVVRWKSILRRELDNEEYVWTYRRSDEDNYYQARIETMDVYDHPETEVMLDTSGSVDEEMLRNFLRQLKPLLRESKMRVGCFDTKFYGFSEIKRDKDINTFKILGRGGTSFDEALKHFTPGAEINKIIFTDGCDNVTLNEYNIKLKNVIWLVFENRDFNPCCGKVIFVDSKQLKYLQGMSLEEIQEGENPEEEKEI